MPTTKMFLQVFRIKFQDSSYRMKDLPVINVPDYSVDLGVISASFGAK
ncbi:MAG: hypothetical protein R2847_10770 [Bacteroidia bacterium]